MTCSVFKVTVLLFVIMAGLGLALLTGFVREGPSGVLKTVFRSVGEPPMETTSLPSDISVLQVPEPIMTPAPTEELKIGPPVAIALSSNADMSSQYAALDNASAPHSWGAPRLFEAFLFFKEIELLEIRLAELYDAVEKFIVVETLQTFQGPGKESYFKGVEHLLPRKYIGKILHYQCSQLDGRGSWDREASARDCVKRAVLAAGARRYDLVHFNDADEIARLSTMTSIIGRTKDIMLAGDEAAGVPKLKQMFPMGIEMQYYVHNFLTVPRSDPPWISELFLLLDASSFRHMRRRYTPLASTVRDGGWHCSWCFPTVKQFAEKFHAYSHTETVDSRNYAADHVWKCTCDAQNIFRFRGPFRDNVRIPRDTGVTKVPQYLQERASDPRFMFLVPDRNSCRIALE
jgi:hypothetical protein